MALSLEQIRHRAAQVAASHGLDIVEIEYLGGGKQRLLRVFVEKNAAQRARLGSLLDEVPGGLHRGAAAETSPAQIGGGAIPADQLAWVTHEDCERFSRDFGAVLDVEELVPGQEYTLEVSSPGLDRRLTARGDFERFRGRPIKVRTSAPIAGNRHWQGRLADVGTEGIVLDLTSAKPRKKKGTEVPQTIEIAFALIEKANLDPQV